MVLTRRQKEILDFVRSFLDKNGYSPSLAEIAEHFHLSSVATVYKHILNLQTKGYLVRKWNVSRSIELTSSGKPTRKAVPLPLMGRVAAGSPIESVPDPEEMAVPEELVSGKKCYALQVTGDSMIDEQIRDGDYVIVDSRREARGGEMVIALVDGEATLKRFFKEKGKIRLQPSNPEMEPIYVKREDLKIQGIVIGVIRKY